MAHQIFVKTLQGKTITLDFNTATDTISDIKNKILSYEGIQPQHQMLTYRGKMLQSNHTAKHYKLHAFDTIDLSLKLLSSPTVISIKLQNHKNDIRVPFTPFTTLKDIQNTLHTRLYSTTLPKYFVLNHRVLKDPSVRIADIDAIWEHLQLHTTFHVPYTEASSVVFRIVHNKKNVLQYEPSAINDHNEQTIKALIEDFLRSTNIDPRFYSGFCPFKSITVRYNKTELFLRVKDASEYAETFEREVTDALVLDECYDKKFGLIPDGIKLRQLSEHFSDCDCCPPHKIEADNNDKHVLHSKELEHREPGDNIIIDIELADKPFILHHKYYYVDGFFYPKNITKKAKIDLQLFPVMRSPQALNEELLIYGYVLRKAHLYHMHIPTEIMQVIILLYPSLYGSKYDIVTHNADLCNKLYQKTDAFVIDDICFYLKYGTESEPPEDAVADQYLSQLLHEDDAYYLVVDFTKQQTISHMVILCTIYCKISKQSYTFLRGVTPDEDDDPLHYIRLPDFGIASSLSSLVCEVQIVNMLKFCGKVSQSYEYPVLLRQRAYLLEWKIDCELMTLFKNCVLCDYNQSFESGLFYDLFKLRCYPNEKKRLLLSIQLIALPVNRPDKKRTSGLKAKCQVYELETCTNTGECETVFDYEEDKSAIVTMLMNSDKFMDQKELTFRVKIRIMDPSDTRASPLMNLLGPNRGRKRRKRRR